MENTLIALTEQALAQNVVWVKSDYGDSFATTTGDYTLEVAHSRGQYSSCSLTLSHINSTVMSCHLSEPKDPVWDVVKALYQQVEGATYPYETYLSQFLSDTGVPTDTTDRDDLWDVFDALIAVSPPWDTNREGLALHSPNRGVYNTIPYEFFVVKVDPSEEVEGFPVAGSIEVHFTIDYKPRKTQIVSDDSSDEWDYVSSLYNRAKLQQGIARRVFSDGFLKSLAAVPEPVVEAAPKPVGSFLSRLLS